MKTRKVRLVGGPLGGRVVDVGGQAGANEIVMTGPKKMTRKQKYEHFTDARYNSYGQPPQVPMVRAIYRLAVRPHSLGGNVAMLPCQHPDGSLFYEYVKPKS